MQTSIRGKNVTVSDADREYVERKMQRLERMLDDRSQAEVELRLEGRTHEENSHVVEVTLMIDGTPLRGTAGASTFRAASDDVIDKLERRTVEYKERPRDRARSGGARHSETPMTLPEDLDGGAGAGPLVVKIKRFGIKPMFWEDAVSRMEELGHAFFIFVNAENERIAVLYRRKDGRYGLIEPVIGGSYVDHE